MASSEWNILVSIPPLQSVSGSNQEEARLPFFASLGNQIRVDPNSPINWINPEMIVPLCDGWTGPLEGLSGAMFGCVE